MQVLQAEFWESAWKEFRQEHRPFEMGAAAVHEQVDRWNRRADSFARLTGGGHGNRRWDQVFNFLQGQGALGQPMRVLDIGCGPGNFAIPLAAAGHTVVALDPAPRMLDILKENLPRELEHLVTTVEDLWEDVDVTARGWENSFDLVFASMSPGVHDRTTLEKMILCSRGWCYLSSFAGPRQYSLYEELWPLLFGKPFKNHVNDIIYPFNLLYAMGYKPAVSFADQSKNRQEPVEEVVRDITLHLGLIESGITVTQELSERVTALVRARAVNGKVAHQLKSWVGLILWQVARN